MRVRMSVRFGTFAAVVRVLMVFIVAVPVSVGHLGMRMLMLVMLGQHQPCRAYH